MLFRSRRRCLCTCPPGLHALQQFLPALVKEFCECFEELDAITDANRPAELEMWKGRSWLPLRLGRGLPAEIPPTPARLLPLRSLREDEPRQVCKRTFRCSLPFNSRSAIPKPNHSNPPKGPRNLHQLLLLPLQHHPNLLPSSISQINSSSGRSP